MNVEYYLADPTVIPFAKLRNRDGDDDDRNMPVVICDPFIDSMEPSKAVPRLQTTVRIFIETILNTS